MKGQLPVANAQEYLDALEEPRKSDITKLHDLIREVAPDLEPHIRSGILAFGSYHYKYPSGREGEWFRIGVSSNKSYISLYCCAVDEEGYVTNRFRESLPKAKIGKSCVTFKRVDDLDESALRDLIAATHAGTFGM